MLLKIVINRRYVCFIFAVNTQNTQTLICVVDVVTATRDNTMKKTQTGTKTANRSRGHLKPCWQQEKHAQANKS